MSEKAKWKVTGTLPEVYEEVFVPAVVHMWVSHLADRVDLKTVKSVLDVACGTGVVTHQFADRMNGAGKIIGYDISPEMLAIATSNANDGIEWRLGDAMSLPFPNDFFDVVTCQFGLMFFEDRVKGLREMYRVLAPQGQLLVLVWGAIEQNLGFFAVAEGFRRHVSVDASESIRGSFTLGDRQQVRSLADAAGFQNAVITQVTAQAHFPSVETLVHGYGALLQPPIDETTQLELLAEITTTLQSYVHHEGLVFPMEAILMHVRK